MANFQEHIDQARRNLAFLVEINSSSNCNNVWDWQVTICYYVAIHVINAHIANAANLHYRTHEAVKNIISPYSSNTACKVPPDIYTSFGKLEGLSRRSRYLCHQDASIVDDVNHLTIDKHFSKAIKHLDKILDYFATKYSVSFTPQPKVSCPHLTKQSQLSVFTI